MKKLLFALAAAGGFALTGAATATDSTGFETAEELAKGHWWYYTTTTSEDGSAVTQYTGSEVTAPTKENWFTNQVSGAAANGGTSFLALSTEGGTLYRSINEAAGGTGDASTGLGTAIDLSEGSLYIDTLVQFTVCEDEPTVDANAKLAIWLGVVTNAAGEVTSTNLFVKAGAWNGSEKVDTIFTAGRYEAGEWYRLTVSAYANVVGSGHPGFTVAVDGTLVTPTVAPITSGTMAAGLDAATTFLSLDQTVTTLAGVGFQGTGAVDNYVVSDEDPLTPPITSVDFTLAWTAADLTALTYTIGSGSPVTVDNLSAGYVTFAVPVAEGVAQTVTVAPTFVSGKMTAASWGAENGSWSSSVLSADTVTAPVTGTVAAAAIAIDVAGTPYRSLADAVAAGYLSGAVTLYSDATTADTLALGGNATINLNNNTLTYTGSGYAIEVGGCTATIQSGTITSAGGGVLVNPVSEATTEATLANLTVTANTLDAIRVATEDETQGTATLTVNSGTYTSTAGSSFSKKDGLTGTFTIANGVTFADKSALDVLANTQYIADNTFVVTANPTITVTADANTTVSPAAGRYNTYRPGSTISFDLSQSAYSSAQFKVVVDSAAAVDAPNPYVYTVTTSDASLAFSVVEVITGVDFSVAADGTTVTAVSYTIDGTAAVGGEKVSGGEKVVITPTKATGITYPIYTVDNTTFTTDTYTYTVPENPAAAIALTVTAVDASASGDSSAAAEAIVAGASAAKKEAAETKVAALTTAGATGAEIASWMENKSITADALADSSYAVESYKLGTALFENAPTAEVTAASASGDALTVSFQIKDGATAKEIASTEAYVKSLFKYSTDLGTWSAAPAEAVDTAYIGSTLTATVDLSEVNGVNGKAFIKIGE